MARVEKPSSDRAFAAPGVNDDRQPKAAPCLATSLVGQHMQVGREADLRQRGAATAATWVSRHSDEALQNAD